MKRKEVALLGVNAVTGSYSSQRAQVQQKIFRFAHIAPSRAGGSRPVAESARVTLSCYCERLGRTRDFTNDDASIAGLLLLESSGIGYDTKDEVIEHPQSPH